jgi:hypothetical protein
MAEQDPNVREALEGLDPAKRETLTRLVSGSAFIAPIVASFAMQGMAIRPAEALPASSGSNVTVSDMRLKKDVVRVGTHPMGFGIYRFKYLWSDTAYVGVLAQEVLKKLPQAVKAGPGDFLAVDYDAIDMQMTRSDVRLS